jgi:hypothetical protein
VLYCPDSKVVGGYGVFSETATFCVTMVTLRSQKGEDIFLAYKAARVSVMPHNPHGGMAPYDCKYHAIAKEAERTSRPDNASDAEITVRTTNLGDVKADSI